MYTVNRRLVIASAFALLAGSSAVIAESSAPAEDMAMANKFMQTAQAFVQSAIGSSGNVGVSIQGDTATLVGFVENSRVKTNAERAALKDERVTKVNNYIVAN